MRAFESFRVGKGTQALYYTLFLRSRHEDLRWYLHFATLTSDEFLKDIISKRKLFNGEFEQGEVLPTKEKLKEKCFLA